jgi:hypothetical protein
MHFLKFFGLTAFLMLFGCRNGSSLAAGRYTVADAEFNQDNYALKRVFQGDGSFTESHSLSNCLLMEMQGHWTQKGDELKLAYTAMHQRHSCHDPLPDFKADSASLTIPIRNVHAESFESFMTASGGKGEKWLLWNRDS